MAAIDSASVLASRLYCPLLFRMAARLEQMSWFEFTSDPIDTAIAIRNAQSAVGADLVINWFDTWSESEALGAAIQRDSDGNPVSSVFPPRSLEPLAVLKSELLPRLKEVAARLHAERRPGTLVAGFLTGPWTLARRIGIASEPEAIQLTVQWMVELIRVYGEIGLDLSIVAEEEPGAFPFYRGQAKQLQPIVNLSRYYRRPLIVLNRSAREDEIANVTIGGAPQIGTVRIMRKKLFTSSVSSWTGQLTPILSKTEGGRIMFVSSWEVPVEAEPERLLELGARLKGGGA
jgi:hypothetical protein